MSDEVTVNYGLAVRKGSLVFSYPQNSLKVDMTGNAKVGNTQNIGTTFSGLNVAGATVSPRYGVFANLSSVSGQYIDVGASISGAFVPVMRLYDGDVAILPLQTLSLYAQAGSGTAKLDYTIFEK